MKEIIQQIKYLPALILVLIVTGCASRNNVPELTENAATGYSLKNGNKVVDDILFCRKVDRESGELIGKGEKFTIMDEVRIQAIVSLSDYILENEKLSMFHFDWISASGYTTYLRRVDYTPGDSLDYLRSSISISPETRTPGICKLRVYYFRELIAEKNFELLPEFDPSTYNLESLSENLLTCKKISKKSGDPIGVNHKFNQSAKASIRAAYKLDNSISLSKKENLYRFDWYKKGDTVAFYRKHVDVVESDSLKYISSSLSIATDKREPGEYFVVMNLFGKPIAQKEITLLPPIDYSAINANIILYKKKSKKTGKLIGKGTQFEIGKKKKVRAIVNISGLDEFIGKELEFKMRWIGPDGKSVYSKTYILKPEKSREKLSGSISITPGKRKVGTYSLQVYLNGELMEEKNFELR